MSTCSQAHALSTLGNYSRLLLGLPYHVCLHLLLTFHCISVCRTQWEWECQISVF